MSIENPFSKIIKARKESDARKLDAARKPGTLNPRGRGGPIFDEMKESFQTLGINDEDVDQSDESKEVKEDEDNESAETEEGRVQKKVDSIRNLFEKNLRNRGLRIYNEYLQGKKGSPSHATFVAEVEKSFNRGFDSYLKVALRLDEKDAPKPHNPRRTLIHGAGHRMVSDENDKDFYLKKYLVKGNDVVEDLPINNPKAHGFEPTEDFEGYATKYQQTSGEGDEKSAMEAYMFEKLRLFSGEFFDMLDESLRRGVHYKNAIDLAEYVYGNNASIYAEMEEKGIESNVVAWQSKANRARVRVSLETYLALGPKLEEQYPYVPGFGNWVTSPKMIRNIIFKHPNTAEQGLLIVDRELSRLKELFPHVPQRLIIELCVSSPDQYEESIRNFVDQTELLMQKYPISEMTEGLNSNNSHVFAYYQMDGPVLTLLERTSVKNWDKEMKRVLESFEQILTKAEAENIDTSYSAQRRMLRSLLSYNAAPEKVLRHELHAAERRLGHYNKLVARAEKTDPIWGEYYVDLGHGETDEEILSNGKTIVDLIVEHYGPDDGEEYLINTLHTFYVYIDSGFSDEKEDLDALKDALTMDPFNTKNFYEHTLRREWPEGFEEIQPNNTELS